MSQKTDCFGMKGKIWLLQLPLVFLFTFSFLIVHWGEQGELESPVLREYFFNPLRTVSGSLTNLKFKLRGTQARKHKIVVVGIDDESIETYGRWPWPRNYVAALVNEIYNRGAKVVGLDMVFSEREERVPLPIKDKMIELGLQDYLVGYVGDETLQEVMMNRMENLVIGWTPSEKCQPKYNSECRRALNDPRVQAKLEIAQENTEQFALKNFIKPDGFDIEKTSYTTAYSILKNIDDFNVVSSHAGFFDAEVDPDGYIRRTSPVIFTKDRAYPSLGLEMASVILGEEPRLMIDQELGIESLDFPQSDLSVEVSRQGIMEINFRGGREVYPEIQAAAILQGAGVGYDEEEGRRLASQFSPDAFDDLKDAYVLVGATALAIYDMRHFPFESNVAGVYGHANILDNILSGDSLETTTSHNGLLIILLFMTLLAVAYAMLTERMESVPALIVFVTMAVSFGLIDQKLLFENDINWNTSFLYMQYFSIFVCTVAAKYILEEKNKKFLKSAFSMYVAPALVDSIVKDPSKLSLGGDKKELTILFSDIRSFTTMSEKMDAKILAKFLNDYLTIMTEIVFKTGGTLDKYIGDAVMAFWGAPVEVPDHAGRTCDAAIQMMRALGEHQDRFLEEYGIDVRIGIGVNTGLVNVGNMGSNENFNYTVIGDHVNLAARLEGLTKPYHSNILVTRFTLDSILEQGGTLPQHRTLDFVKVKGKNQAVELLQVLDVDRPQQGLDMFEEARKLYEAQRWNQAIEGFQAANDILCLSPQQPDGPSEMYIERCEHFKKNPPGEEWDGSWTMTSK